VLLLFSILTFPLGRAAAQTTNILARVTQAVDERNLVVMKGNVHPLARPEFDQGAAPLDLRMDRMLLVLKRSPEQESALQKLLEDQQDKSSPRYRQWLTPEQFGQHFGPEDSDIQKVTDWLQGHGFQKLRYFRHPYLDVGRDVETRRDAEAFLVARGYRLAPVTMDAWDWAFSRVYDDAKKRADTALQQEVVSAYLSYSAAMLIMRRSSLATSSVTNRNKFCCVTPIHCKPITSVSCSSCFASVAIASSLWRMP